MTRLAKLARVLRRFLLVWVVDAVSLVVTAGRAAASKLAEHDAEHEQQEAADVQAAAAADVIVCATGNLAHVCFDLASDKITLSQIDAAYPSLVDALVQHEGIGLVVGYADDGAPLVIGKQGRRHLGSGLPPVELASS